MYNKSLKRKLRVKGIRRFFSPGCFPGLPATENSVREAFA
jgi:hypothetical protein